MLFLSPNKTQLKEIEIVRTSSIAKPSRPFSVSSPCLQIAICNDTVIAFGNNVQKKEGDYIVDNLTKAINKRETLNIRIKPEERNLIDRAAKVRGKNRTDFILDAVRSAAEETLYNQTIILTSPEAYAKFLAQLDAQPFPNARLRKTMQTPAPWEKE